MFLSYSKNWYKYAFFFIFFCGTISTRAQTNSTSSKKEGYSSDPKVVEKGKQLFLSNCTACHNFTQKGIGPSLEKATTDLPSEWLTKFIANAPEMISGGDARAVSLFEEYKQMMPTFTHLKPEEIESILAFIHTNQQKENTKDSYKGVVVLNPVEAKIQPASWKLELKHFATAPFTASKGPLARITKMDVLRGGAKERTFIVDLRGILYELVDNQWQVYLDMAKERPNFIPIPGLATGFGSFAFHPEFYKNGLFYTTHTEKPNSAKADFGYADSIKVTLQWVITEWKIDNPNAGSFLGKSREIFRINMVSPIHGMQEIAFNPTARKGSSDYGLLYVGIGDGGASENGFAFICADNTRPWSSVLRIDPMGRNSKNGKYGIPKNNPFANDKNEKTLGEVYIRGFRNPNRYTWTPNGTLLVVDIGQTNIEELNIAKAGADYGWPEREGTFVINHRGKMDRVYALTTDEPRHKYTYPVVQYDHDEGKAISGGVVYNGTAVPALKGKYIFGDINNGRVFAVETAQLKLGKQANIQEVLLKIEGEEKTFLDLHPKIKPDLRLGEGPKGELFIFTKADGKVYEVVGVSNP